MDSARVRFRSAPRARAVSSPIATRVERPGEQQREDRADRDERQDLRDGVVGGRGQRTDRPEAHPAERGVVRDHHGLEIAVERGADRGAGEREPHGRGTPAAAEEPDQRSDGGGPEEGEPHIAAERGDAEEGDGGDDGGRRARVDAEQPGIGQRDCGSAPGARLRTARARHRRAVRAGCVRPARRRRRPRRSPSPGTARARPAPGTAPWRRSRCSRGRREAGSPERRGVRPLVSPDASGARGRSPRAAQEDCRQTRG